MTTKNRQPDWLIREMVKNAFPHDEVEEIKELTEGMCNVAYMITISSGQKVVLKIAAAEPIGFLLNEAELMETEVAAMSIIEKYQCVHVPKVLYYDFSRRQCTGSYFIMEALDGVNYFSVKDQYSESDNGKLSFEIGKIVRSISQIGGEKFGSPISSERQFEYLYDCVRMLISNVLIDGAAKEIVIGVAGEQILAKLETDKPIFDAVTEPVFVHLDMWEGNIFVQDMTITGVIDWERALWGDVLMEERFRAHSRNADFLRGFGRENFSDEEWRRIYWYDVYVYLTMMVEGAFRGYETDWQYQWVKPLFEKAWELLNQ